MDQQAEVTIDAIPNRIFKGHVIEIGNTEPSLPERLPII
jgi:hypothetical protein